MLILRYLIQKHIKNTQVCVMNVSKAISVCCWKVRRGIV